MKKYFVFTIVVSFCLFVSITAAQSSVKPTPTPADPYVLTADDLQTAYKASAGDKPGVWDMDTHLGDVSMEKREYAEAIKYYTKTIKAYPKFADAYIKRGDAYTAIKSSKLALADYQKALDLDPGNKDAEKKLGGAHFLAAYNNPDPTLSKSVNGMIADEKAQEKTKPKATTPADDKLLELSPDVLEGLSQNLKDKYPEASKLSDKPYSEIKSPDDWRKLFVEYSTNFNAQNKIFVEKVTALKKIQNSSYPLAQCDELLDVKKVLPSMEIALKDMERFYNNTEAVKVITGGEMKQLKYIVEDWGVNTFLKLKYEVPTNIDVLNCKVDPNQKKVTFDDVMEMAGNEIEAKRQNGIIDQLRLLGDLKSYFAAGQRFNALTTGSSPMDVCTATIAFKRESDAIEPILNKIDEINEDGLPVKFENAEAAKRLDTTLKFHAQLFTPKKADIARVAAKYGCK